MRIGNWPLVMMVLEHVIKHPGQYSQATWGRRRECGTTRCIAGWLAHFAGWRDYPEPFEVSLIFAVTDETGKEEVSIERAALASLELDPEVYGLIPLTRDRDEDDLSAEAEALAAALFGGHIPFGDILSTLYTHAQADGVTFTPLILAEMKKEGVIA